jgi:hypothetical protein
MRMTDGVCRLISSYVLFFFSSRRNLSISLFVSASCVFLFSFFFLRTVFHDCLFFVFFICYMQELCMWQSNQQVF